MTTPTINPVLHYADLDKAVEYLKETFGFREHVVHRDPEGNPMYAELELDGCYVGVGGKARGAAPSTSARQRSTSRSTIPTPCTTAPPRQARKS